MQNEHVKLKSYDQLVELFTEFDNFCGTKTYVAKSTLEDIGIVRKKPYDGISDDIEEMISDMTKLCGSKFLTNHPKANSDLLEKSNTIAVIGKDIANGGRIIHPMCIHYFGKKVACHPGNSRLYFQRIYPYPVYTIFTDYKGDIKERFPHIKFCDPKDHEFNVKGLNYVSFDNLADKCPRGIQKVTKDRLCYIQEVIEDWPQELGDPTLYNPPKEFKIVKGRVYLDNQLIYQKFRTEWRVVIDTKHI